MRIFAIPFEEISCTRDLKRKSEGLFIGVWRSWLAHLVWDQRVLCSSHSTPTYERLSVWMTSFFVYDPVCMRCGQNQKNESQMSNAFETRKILSILRFYNTRYEGLFSERCNVLLACRNDLEFLTIYLDNTLDVT